MPVVLATRSLHPAAVRRLETAATVRVASGTAPETLIREAEDADVIIVRDPLPPELFSPPPETLRAVVRHGAGLDLIPVSEATAAGVLVANVPGANAQSVAEHVVSMMLALARGVPQAERNIHTEWWSAGHARAFYGREVAGRTLGLVGTGNVGRAIHTLVSAGLGMRVLGLGSTPHRTPPGVEFRCLDRLLAESDVVVVACPLTTSTRGLLGAAQLAQMRADALLINISRSAVVDHDALLSALRDGALGGAALDVLDDDPWVAEDPSETPDNLVVTPHVAGITAESMERMGLGAADVACTILAGGTPDTLVNGEALAAYRSRTGS